MKRILAKISFIILICLFVALLWRLLSHVIHRQDFLFDILLICLLLLLLRLNFITLYPLVFHTEEKELPGLFPFFNYQSDILLFIDYDSIKKKINTGVFDYSLSWINLLNKECGYFSIVNFKDRQNLSYKEKRVIIITSSVLECIEQKDIEIFKDFVSSGGTLCIELPNEAFSYLTGCVPTGVFQDVSRITKLNGPLHFKDALQAMPLFFKLKAPKDKDINVEVVLNIDDKPAICKNRFNKGAVISIFFDVGMQLSILRQGFSCVPLEGGRNKRKKFLEIREVVSDIVPNKNLLDNELPFVDILEALIFNIISSCSLCASWWYYPRMYKAALLLTHDEDYYADKCLEVSEYERKLNVNSTFFVMPDSRISSRTLEAMQKNRTEIGIHWNRFFLHINNTGMHKNRLATLDAQLANLKKNASLQDISINRIHWLKIDRNVLRPFRILAACGIKVDSSFGPHSREKGYIFGTGFPYYLLDENGGIINTIEFPFQVQDRRHKATATFVRSLVRESIKKWHTSIVILYHPHHFGRRNGVWRDWESLLNLMNNKDIWRVNFKNYLSFWYERSQSSINTLFDEQKNILSISVDAKGGKTLRIPLANDKLRLKTIYGNDNQIEFNKIDGYAFFSISEGMHKFYVHYG